MSFLLPVALVFGLGAWLLRKGSPSSTTDAPLVPAPLTLSQGDFRNAFGVLALSSIGWSKSVEQQLAAREIKLMSPRQSDGSIQALLVKVKGGTNALDWIRSEIARGNAVLITLDAQPLQLLSVVSSTAVSWAPATSTAAGPRGPRLVLDRPEGLPQ